MAKKVWDLKHSKITLTSNRREIILEYKDDGTFKSSVWLPIKHAQDIFDYKTEEFKGWKKYISMGCHFIDKKGESYGCLGNIKMFNFLKYWVNHTATYKKTYGYFDDDIPTYALQCLDCYLLDDGIDWDPKDYNLPEASFPKDLDDLILETEK